MDDNTSLRNRTQYGFQDGDRKVYSNLPLDHLMMWMDRLETTNRKRQEKGYKPLFEEGKDLVIIRSDSRDLEHITKTLFPNFVEEAKHDKIPLDRLPHHNTDAYLESYQSTDEESSLVKVEGRVKSRDSSTEKLTRYFSARETVEVRLTEPEFDLPYHVCVKDIIGLTLVFKDEESLREKEKELNDHPQLALVESEEHTTPQYRAVHNIYVWKGNTIPTGTVIEFHLETKEEHEKNKHGLDGARSHYDYCLDKLEMPHKQGSHQIIVLEKNGRDHEELRPTTSICDFVEYTLINY